MHQDIDFVGVFINWFPMLLLIAVWVFFLRRMYGYSGFTKYQTATLEHMERQSKAIERVAAVLEKGQHPMQ